MRWRMNWRGVLLLSLLASADAQTLTETPLDAVWAANAVDFALHTVGRRQYAAYFDSKRMMTVAARSLDGGEWQRTTLPNQLVWDSHNGVALAVDEAGYVHVSGNMHANPLVYFRSARPYDISEMLPLHRMTGDDERSVTYPKFFTDQQGRLLFSYRSGTCGNGNILVNRFEPEQQRWVRHLSTALFEGIYAGDDRAAYHTFAKDADGTFHWVWMWRWTPMVETCHQLCYAKSPDLLHWTNAAGQPVELPFRPDLAVVTVDNTPSQGGMHNGRFQIIVTPDGVPLLGYVKYDAQGLTQLYLARPEGDGWLIRQVSQWDFRWDIHGGGDQMTSGGVFQFVDFATDGTLAIEWRTETGERGVYRVDPQTLQPVDSQAPYPPRWPSAIRRRLTEAKGLNLHLQADAGPAQPDGTRYALKWEAARASHGGHGPAIIPDGPLSPLVVVSWRPD